MVERRREEGRRRREEEVVEARRDPTSGQTNAPIVDLDAVLLPAQGRADQVAPLPQVIDAASDQAYAEEVCVIVTENCVTVSRMSFVERALSVVVPSVVNLGSTLVPSKPVCVGVRRGTLVTDVSNGDYNGMKLHLNSN